VKLSHVIERFLAGEPANRLRLCLTVDDRAAFEKVVARTITPVERSVRTSIDAAVESVYDSLTDEEKAQAPSLSELKQAAQAGYEGAVNAKPVPVAERQAAPLATTFLAFHPRNDVDARNAFYLTHRAELLNPTSTRAYGTDAHERRRLLIKMFGFFPDKDRTAFWRDHSQSLFT
jgi:hypothetical protein